MKNRQYLDNEKNALNVEEKLVKVKDFFLNNVIIF